MRFTFLVMLMTCALALGAIEVPRDLNAPPAEKELLTSVVVTQCNQIVAVYITMRDGRLLRFDKSSNVPSAQLLELAYRAPRSERVETSCNDVGIAGFENHDKTI